MKSAKEISDMYIEAGVSAAQELIRKVEKALDKFKPEKLQARPEYITLCIDNTDYPEDSKRIASEFLCQPKGGGWKKANFVCQRDEDGSYLTLYLHFPKD